MPFDDDKKSAKQFYGYLVPDTDKAKEGIIKPFLTKVAINFEYDDDSKKIEKIEMSHALKYAKNIRHC